MPCPVRNNERLAWMKGHNFAVSVAVAQLHAGCARDEIYDFVGVEVTLTTVT